MPKMIPPDKLYAAKVQGSDGNLFSKETITQRKARRKRDKSAAHLGKISAEDLTLGGSFKMSLSVIRYAEPLPLSLANYFG